VRDEPWIAQWARAQAHERGDVESLEHGVDGHALAASQQVREIDGLPVDEDEVDLGVRNATGFDRVFHGARTVDFHGKLALAPFGGQKIVQLLVKAKKRGRSSGMVHLSCRYACRTTPIVACRRAATMPVRVMI